MEQGVSGTGAPSRTAMMAACGRVGHLFNYGADAMLSDWLAWPLIGSEAETMLAGLREAFGEVSVRLANWLAARTRISEDWLAASEAKEYVILGAGLDTFAWRQPSRGGIRVIEIDHPSTQAWKRSRIEALGVSVPSTLTWAPVDFEVESVAAGLERAGVNSDAVFVSWLGVTTYLSLAAISATLRSLPQCSIAVSYATPEQTWHGEARAISREFGAMASATGEPLISHYMPDEFAAVLADNGFDVVEDVGADEVESRYGPPALAIGDERVALARSRR
ncbi:MAG TPA: class I SAM-dependent methyltransferase [Mycobacterium sp.]|nr:class I SAM-dependent methyltransferase [Mycobacterium sp.]